MDWVPNAPSVFTHNHEDFPENGEEMTTYSSWFLLCFFCSSLSRQYLIHERLVKLQYCSDIYYLAFSNALRERNILIYLVYAAEDGGCLVRSALKLGEIGTL